MRAPVLLALGITVLVGARAAAEDFGALIELQLIQRSAELFGIEAPLVTDGAAGSSLARRRDRGEADQIALARGLAARFLTRRAADGVAAMALWPPHSPTHLIVCTGGARREIGLTADRTVRFNPSLQRVSLTGGAVTTILRGLDNCGAIAATPWGTVLVAEAGARGAVYEILGPLIVTEAQVLDREKGLSSNPERIALRSHLPRIAWRGLAALPSGLVYGSDSMAPGELGADREGGAIYKFVPDRPHAGGPIASLDASPLVSGRSYALQISCSETELRFGQGCETGIGGWLEVAAPDARFEADGFGATGFDRPQGIRPDPHWRGTGLRLCFATPGRAAAARMGAIYCLTDKRPQTGAGADGVPVPSLELGVFRFGDAEFNGFGALAFSPVATLLFIGETGAGADVLACLDDGADADALSDGCIRVAALKDGSAQARGLVFSGDGQTLYLAAGSSLDEEMPGSDSFPTDDIFRITGFRRMGPPE